MFSATEIFSVSGPSHLTVVDWENPHHRRAIAASLVEGAYKIERDRQDSRHGKLAQAAPYWEFFHFRLNKILVDDADHSIFGAIYEYTFQTPSNSFPNNSTLKPPKFVVAFRGTLTQPDTRFQDLKLDFKCICNTIHDTSRVQVAIQTVQDVCSFAGHSNVWLVGHSLGSAIALLTGKNMAKLGFPLETYLFNPPYIAAPIESIKEERIRHGIRIAGSVMKAGLGAVVNSGRRHISKKSNGSRGGSSHGRYHNHDDHDHDYDQERDDRDSFAKLSSWFPCLFLNHADMICSGYIGYFEHRKKMEEIGADKIGKFATMSSVESILAGALGKESEPYDLLPSALVTVNLTPAPDFLKAHGLEQWWNPNFHYRSLTYQFTR